MRGSVYDHLAGTVGVAVCDALLTRGLLIDQGRRYEVTDRGVVELGQLGVDVAALERRSRPLARACMDWSERRDHLAGSLGAALMSRLTELQWVRPREASRIVHVTAAGRDGLRDWLGIEAA